MKEKNKAIFDKAYDRLLQMYKDKYDSPDIRIISRFYDEKKLLQESEYYVCFLDFIGRLSEYAESKGEEIAVRGTTGASFIAYLLGATDINPLPIFEYCPHCKTVRFLGAGNPFDRSASPCHCGTGNVVDGYNIPFESNLKSVSGEYIQIAVSEAFFDEAKKLILEEEWDEKVTLVETEGKAPVKFYFGSEAYNSEDVASCPRITLVPYAMLDKFRELEKATGIKWRKHSPHGNNPHHVSFCKDDVKNVPQFKGEFCSELLDKLKPQNTAELLGIIGFAHSVEVWNNNAALLYDRHKKSLNEIPAFREDLYNMICERLRQKGIYGTGLAYEVMENAAKGHYRGNDGMEENTMVALLELGFDMDFVLFIEKIGYMFPKPHGISYMKDALRLMFYKQNFSDIYDSVMETK